MKSTRLLRPALALALVALLAPGCKKDAAEAPPGAAQNGGSGGGGGGAIDTKGFPAVGEAPQIEVVNQGAEPRQQLRYKVQAGHSEQMLMVMNMQMSMTMGGNAMPSAELPAMELSAAVDVKEVTGEGDIRYEFRFTDANVVESPSVNPQVVAAIRDALQGVTTLKGEAVVSPRGVVKKAAIDVSGIENPQLKQMMENLQRSLDQMSVPLPEQAVGQGAEWKVKQAIEQGGLRVFQTSTMKLASLEGDKVKLDVQVEQNAPQQTFSPPGMPSGASAQIDKLHTTGAGTTTVDLNRIIPTSKLNMKTNMAMVIQMGDQRQPMGTDMTVDMSIQPK